MGILNKYFQPEYLVNYLKFNWFARQFLQSGSSRQLGWPWSERRGWRKHRIFLLLYSLLFCFLTFAWLSCSCGKFAVALLSYYFPVFSLIYSYSDFYKIPENCKDFISGSCIWIGKALSFTCVKDRFLFLLSNRSKFWEMYCFSLN